MQTHARATEQKHISIYIFLWRKTFLKMGVYILSLFNIHYHIDEKTKKIYVPVSDIQNSDCHQLAPLKDQSRTPCTTCSHQQECYEQQDPKSGVNCTKKVSNYFETKEPMGPVI